MKMFCTAGLGVLLCLLPGHEAASAPQHSSGPVALVYVLTGEATLTLPAEGNRPLRLFDYLPEGARVELGPDSRLALAFINGRRYELGEGSQAKIGQSDLASRSGPVRSLPTVPPLPRLSAIAEEEHPGLRAGAVRIRSERIAGLYPRHGAAALAGATVLSFEPVAGAERYRIEVQDSQGKVAFATETASSPVKLPPGALRPGTRYGWTVRTVDRLGSVARGDESFVTLPARIASAREALRKAVENLGDSASLALLAEVDRSLGLLVEAREELQAAVREAPRDAALAAALVEFERSLEEESPEVGVVIEEVTPESLGARAELQAGDLLLSWCRAAASPGPCLAEGTFESPFDFAAMDLEQAPRGGVRILGRRAGAITTWALLPGPQSVEVRPRHPEPDAGLDPQSRSLWSLSHEADTLAKALRWQEADALYDRAASRARSLHNGAIEAQILKAWGKTFQDRGAWERAEDLYRRSLDLDRAAGRDLAVAWSLDHLGATVAQHARPREAEALLRQAVEILEALAPRSTSLAASLRNLGNVMAVRGDAASAEQCLRRALSILEDLAPESFETAGALIDLGSVQGSEELFRRAKAICERNRPESLEMANSLYRLGITAVHRGDRDAADYFLRRALALQERLDPSGAAAAHTLESLGLQAYARKDGTQAEEYIRRAMTLNERLAPDGLALAHNLQNLGVIVLYKGDCTAAGKYFQRALAIRQRLNPGSLDVATSLRALGFHGLRCGDLSFAEASYRRALALYEELEPGRIGHAKVLHDVGWTYRQMGRTQLAAGFLCRAVSLVEALLEGSGQFLGSHAAYFTDCLSAQVEAGHEAEAIKVLERGRARIFLGQLAERDLVFSADLPDEIARRRKQLDQEIESAQGALARLGSTREASEAERLLNRLREARDQQRELTLQIRKTSPRLAALQHPEPLDLAGARQALDPGTVLLAYAVTEDKSYLFVIHPSGVPGPGLAVFPLPIGEKALREAIQSFRSLLAKPDSDRFQLTSQATGLYDLLIGPAETRIADAKRILVSPDGPLHTLPFAALVRKGHFLVEWKPVHSVLSATVYAELKRTRRTSADPADNRLIAFGDPIYPPLPESQETAGTAEILTALRNGLSLDPVHSTRNEVESIAALFPHARAFVGEEATEERAKSVASQARLLHFACHGLLNERFPLDSALALTIPAHPVEGRDNGLLQAWEILENVRLDADLVTLSACDTALGDEVGGEGLIGLTRAFQIAGARSVVASLWSVSDVSTGELMKGFYGHLRAGLAKDEALQAAQIELIRAPHKELSHPYHWAAFELFGDWR